MPLPQPPIALADVCSVIFNNTLYTYSSGAFQSLPLTEGATWKQLPAGESVTGGVCVGSTPADVSQAAFFVVGGKGPGSNYMGLQKFTYSTGKWESVPLQPHVTQERLWHGAAYLNSSDTILMYAGNQDGWQAPSSQTFTIGASAPHEVLAYDSIAPPTINPILLPWSNTEAAMIGGSEFNSKVMLFSYESKVWTDSGASLAAPLMKNSTAIQAAMVIADDGSKSLYTFDMTESPNQVNRTVLVNGAGAPVANSVPITARSVDEGPSRRAWIEWRQAKVHLKEGEWPKYNSSLAPTATRTNYAIAEDPNGLVVIAGGNQEDILCIFDGRNNGWVNATEKLADQKLVVQGTEPSSVAPAPSASPTETSAPIGTGGGSSTTLSANVILGIVLGAISGLAVILIIIYILIRRHRKKQDFYEAGHNRRSSGAASPEKGGFAYAADSLPQGPAMGTFRGHQTQDSQGSFSSVAILMGRVNQQKPAGVQRNNSGGTKRSSVGSMFKTTLKSSISKPIPHSSSERNLTARTAPPSRDERGVSFGPNVAEPRPRTGKLDRQGSTRRSSGWNRYWSGGSALNILGFGNKDRRQTVDSDQSSHYSADNHRITQDSATVPPLQMPPRVPEPKPMFQRVNSGSPTMANYDARIKDEMRAQIERPNSRASSHSGYSSGIPASVHDAWDPTFSNKPWGADRAPSNTYGGNFTTALAPAQSSSRPPTGVSQQPQLAMAATSSDMSWLNLGEFQRL